MSTPQFHQATGPSPSPRPTIHQGEGGGLGDDEVLSFDLGRYLAGLRRYAWLIAAILALAITGAVFYTKRQTPIYQAQASVQVEPKIQDLLGQTSELLAVGASSGAALDYYMQQREVLASDALMRRTVEARELHLRLLTEPERGSRPIDSQLDLATLRLRDILAVTYPRQNRTMYVTVRHPDPALAADIANSHIRSYEAYSRGLVSKGSENASMALSGEFEEAKEKARAADDALTNFLRSQGLIAESLEAKLRRVNDNIASFSVKLNEARARRIELSARLDRMKKAAELDVLESPILAMTGSASFDALRAQYYGERNKFLELEKEIGPKAVEYAKAKARVDDLYNALRSEAKRAVGALQEEFLAAQTTERAMDGEVKRFEAEARQLAELYPDHNDLTRKKKSAEDKYNILVGQLSASEMTGRMNSRIDTNYVRPLDLARVPTVPVSPSLKVNIGIAATMALFLGVGLAMLLVYLDRSIKSAEDAQATAQAPVLGVIPVLSESELNSGDDKARDLFVHTHPTSRVAECCRSLRTNIVFSGADRPLKTLVVSSANPREGKTTSVIYLGTTMAQSGQRVLLVDTDMRRPRLHASTGVPKGKGLSNLIVGEDSYDDAIKSTEIPNLFVLPCGPLPPNPAELLMSKRFAVVLEELGRRFDRIILDSPPLGAVTDAVVLSKVADGVMLVVRAGNTLRDEVKRSVRQVRDVDGHIVGVILNEFDIGDRRGYYYRYYGYGEKPNEASSTT